MKYLFEVSIHFTQFTAYSPLIICISKNCENKNYPILLSRLLQVNAKIKSTFHFQNSHHLVLLKSDFNPATDLRVTGRKHYIKVHPSVPMPYHLYTMFNSSSIVFVKTLT